MSTSIPEPDLPEGAEVPEWEGEYLDRVSDRLMFNYDLAKDERVGSEEFDLYGRMQIHNEKHFLHSALSFAHHDLEEHLFAKRAEAVTVADLEQLVDLGHELADQWIESNEEHFSTDFTFVLLVPEIPDDVASFVSKFRDRKMLKYGYHGHYEITFVVAAPEREELVASPEATVEEAFRLWEPIERKEPSLFDLITRRLQI